MQTYHAVPGEPLPLGRLWEHHARRIVFDISAWVETFGAGVVQLLHQRQGDAVPYPVTVKRTDADGVTDNNTTGTLVFWDVTNVDTGQLCRYGKAELRYYRGSEASPEFLAKSDVYKTVVENALGAARAEPPEEGPNWLDTLLDAANRVDNIDDQLSVARGYADAAAQSVADAGTYAANAAQSAQAAAGAAQDADASAQEALQAVADARRFAEGSRSTSALPALYNRSFSLTGSGIRQLDAIPYLASDGAAVGAQAMIPLSVVTTATGDAATGWETLSDATVTAWFLNDNWRVSPDYVYTLDSGNHVLNVQTFFTASGEGPHTLVLAFTISGGNATIPVGTVVSLSGAESFADGNSWLMIQEPPPPIIV